MQKVSDLTDHLGFWLRMVSNHVSQAFAAKVSQMDVTVAEWALMRALYAKDAIAPSRLAEDIGLTRGAVTKLADRLIAKSLLTRTASTQDGRAQTLALTETGTRLVPELAALADANDVEFLGHLTPVERKILMDLLQRTVRHSRITSLPVK